MTSLTLNYFIIAGRDKLLLQGFSAGDALLLSGDRDFPPFRNPHWRRNSGAFWDVEQGATVLNLSFFDTVVLSPRASAPLSGRANFTAAATSIIQDTGPLAGRALFTASGTPLNLDGAFLSGRAVFTATGFATHAGASPLSGRAIFTAQTNAPTGADSGPLSGRAVFVAVGQGAGQTPAASGAGPLTGRGSFTANAGPSTGAGSGPLSGRALFLAQGGRPAGGSGFALLAGTGLIRALGVSSLVPPPAPPPQRIDPLSDRTPIVDPRGRPTAQFVRQWLQSREISITVDGVTASLTKIEDGLAALFARQILAGSGLSGGGNLGSDVTLGLGASGVSPRVYGSATLIPVLAIDSFGRVTNAAEASFSAPTGAGLIGSLFNEALMTGVNVTETLHEIIVPANTMTRDGDVLEINTVGILGQGAVSRTFNLEMFGVAVGRSISGLSGVIYQFNSRIIRRSATSVLVQWQSNAYSGGLNQTTTSIATDPAQRIGTAVADWTQPIPIRTTGFRASNGATVSSQFLNVRRLAAP